MSLYITAHFNEQKKLLHNQLLKKELNIKGQLTKKAISQPATPDAK